MKGLQSLREARRASGKVYFGAAAPVDVAPCFLSFFASLAIRARSFLALCFLRLVCTVCE
jgi:hypothetical protein